MNAFETLPVGIEYSLRIANLFRKAYDITINY